MAIAIHEGTRETVGPLAVELLEVEHLTIDKRYQRDLSKPFVEKIATSWDWRLCGVLHVNQRNGRALVVDGQHRLAAAKMAGIEAVPCLLMADPALDEPRVFVDLQTKRRAVKSSERHVALLAAKDKAATSVEAALREAGCKIVTSERGRTSTTAATACYAILERGGAQHLTDVFMVCRKAWPFAALPATNMLQGLSVFLSTEFRHKIDIDRLVAHLSATTAQSIAIGAKSFNSTAASNIAKELVAIYNRSLEGGRNGRASLDVGAIQPRRKGKATA